MNNEQTCSAREVSETTHVPASASFGFEFLLPRPHFWAMEDFDFDCPAELYEARRRGASRQSMSYKRFMSSAEAIRYAVEVVGADKLWGTVIETETARLDAAEINALYQRDDFPLHGRKK